MNRDEVLELIRRRIYQYVSDKDSSERAMSQKLRKNDGYINSIVNGKAGISLDMIVEICEYMEMPLHLFFYDDVNYPKEANEFLENIKSCNREQIEALLCIVRSMNTTKEIGSEN